MKFFQHFFFSAKNPTVKNVVNAIFWTFIIFGVYFLLLAKESNWQYPRYQGVISFVSACSIVIPVLFYKKMRMHRFYHENALYIFEMLVAIPLALNGLGALYFFDSPFEYDSIIHFLNTAFVTLLIFFVFGAFLKSNTIITRTTLFFLAIAGTFMFGIGMEQWEQFSDLHFGSSAWGQVGQDPWYDTMHDIFANSAGIGTSALLLLFFGEKWLEALRTVSPRVKAFAYTVKEKVDETVREKIAIGTARVRNANRAIRIRGQKTKKRLLRRSKELFRVKEV
ncbi:MAG: hypothetical protein Q7S16_05365 [bacterium]|nr:hypothetical protein [bacterium]